MWSIAPIIGVAVGGAVVLLTVGVVLAVTIERRRHQRLTQRHGVATGLKAYHKAHLSANEHNYRHVPPPRISPRGGCQPRIVETIPQQTESAREGFNSKLISDLPLRPERRQSLRNTFYGHSLYIPKTRRLKKIEKAISFKRIPRSPLSAITEFTDSSYGEPTTNEEIAEETSEVSPRNSTRHFSVNWPLTKAGGGIRLVSNTDSFSTTIQDPEPVAGKQVIGNHVPKPTFGPRSFSTNSTTFNAPDEPLPALPNIDALVKTNPTSQRWRVSTSSVDTVSSSVLGATVSSPSDMRRPPSRMMINSDVQTFDFGLMNHETAPKLGDVPGKRTSQGYRNGGRGIASVHPSMDFQQQKGTNNEHGLLVHTAHISGEQAGLSNLQNINASAWTTNFNTKPCAFSQNRHSMYCGGPKSSQVERDMASENKFGQSAKVGDELRRPASVASSSSCHWKSKPNVPGDRRSVDFSQLSKKGHKRQNCVRISNIPIVETSRAGLINQMPALAEEPNETPVLLQMQTRIPGLDLLEAGQKVPILAAPSGSIASNLESPLQKRPVFGHTAKPKRPSYIRANSSGSLDNSIRESGVTNSKAVGIPEICISSPPQWPLSPIPLHHSKLNVSTPLRNSPQPMYSSPILPSPLFSSHSLFARESLVKGPRTLPRTPRVEKPVFPITARNKQVLAQKNTKHDLRRSVMLLRSMNSEGFLTDRSCHDSDKNLSGITPADKHGPTNLLERNSLLSSKSATGRDSNPLDPFKTYISVSPSAMSTSGGSIWEDASVRGDSPEPEMPSIHCSPYLKSRLPTNSASRLYDHDPEAYENFDQHSSSQKIRSGNIVYRSPQGKGLGLQVGNAILGTPGSLYDVEGFLKD